MVLKSTNLKNRLLRVPLIFVSLVLMGLAILGGLARLGWTGGLIFPQQSSLHGPLMVLGFLATFVSLERAVAYSKHMALLVPLAFATGSVLGLLGMFPQLSFFLWILGCLGLIVLLGYFSILEKKLHSMVLFLGACALLLGTLIFTRNHSISDVVFWWTDFFVLTIAAERLELSRLIQIPTLAKTIFAILSGLAFLGPFLSFKLVALSYVLIAMWLLRYDIAIRTVRFTGLPRYTAFCLLLGNLWLGFSGILIWKFGAQTVGPQYDAFLHALFVGFVFSMIFGHAPIILPAVTALQMEYRVYFYFHLIFLHLSLLLRLVGDLFFQPKVRFAGALGNALAVLLFLLASASSLLLSRRRKTIEGVKI